MNHNKKVCRSAQFALAILLLVPRLSPAEENPSATVKAAAALTSLFSDLIEQFKGIGETAEKQRLADSLVTLNGDLYHLEMEKRYALLVLSRKPLDMDEMRRVAGNLNDKIKQLRSTLEVLVPRLRVAYRAKGDNVIQLLSEALQTRGAVVVNLTSPQGFSVDGSIADSKAAIVALDAAQRSLADAIDALRK